MFSLSFKDCLTNPKQMLRLVVVVICISVSCYQLAECFRKLRNPPISARYSFRLNDTLLYPAVTICRNPPYKYSVFQEFGLHNNEISYSRTWDTFNYKKYSLQDFFDKATYGLQDLVLIAAFDQYPGNLTVTSSFTLKYGRCFTFKPSTQSDIWGFGFGYFFYFNLPDDTASTDENTASSTLGLDVYIHDEKEIFTEKLEQADTFMEYFYLEAGDALQVKLKVNEFKQLPTRNNKCIPSYVYSATKCLEKCLDKLVSEEAECSTPWVPNDDLPICNDNKTMDLVESSVPKSDRLKNFISKCNCAMSCCSTSYTPYIQSSKDLVVGSSDCSLSIYFTSNLVTAIEEISTYDWNVFLADLGGSLGFLLGLSVLGVVGIFEQIISIIIKKADGADGESGTGNNEKKRYFDSDTNLDVNTRSCSEEVNNFDPDVNYAENIKENKIDHEFYAKVYNVNEGELQKF